MERNKLRERWAEIVALVADELGWDVGVISDAPHGTNIPDAEVVGMIIGNIDLVKMDEMAESVDIDITVISKKEQKDEDIVH